ncbi:MAG: ATP-binding protein [Gammaproteobacteria bacterium]|nr:ATP-binding protein [Gammaproteobacteria bacterium]
MVALLLPLIENAAEAAKPGTELDINFHQKNGYNVIRVTNTTELLPGGKEIFDAEFSTKNGHHGLGLSTVKSLLESIEGALIDYTINGDKITFELKLRGAE